MQNFQTEELLLQKGRHRGRNVKKNRYGDRKIKAPAKHSLCRGILKKTRSGGRKSANGTLGGRKKRGRE